MGWKGLFLLAGLAIYSINVQAQIDVSSVQNKNKEFWNDVSFGGGLGLSFGSGYFMWSVAPSAIYNFNEQFSAGVGLSYMYLREKRFNNYRFSAYGGSLIFLYHPIREIQLSVEPELMQVNYTFLATSTGRETERFLQEALFLGAGFRTGNVTIGARYNVLHNKNRNIYGSAFLPFVRVYF